MFLLKFDQEGLIFFDCGNGLKSESSFKEEEPKLNPSPRVDSNPKSNSDQFVTSKESHELEDIETKDDPPPFKALEIIGLSELLECTEVGHVEYVEPTSFGHWQRV
ncbi:hypothetical protein ACJW31_06G220400 [Castanea mollissima]